MARRTVKTSPAAKGESDPSPALVETLANLDFILIIGGALPQQLSIAPPGNHPKAILAQLATKSELPSTSSPNFFSVLEWALAKMGRFWTVKYLNELMDAKTNWAAAPALDGLLSIPPRLILTTWFDPRLHRLLLHSPASPGIRALLNDADLSSVQSGNSRVPLFPLLGTLTHHSSVVLEEADFHSRLHSNSLFHSYCSSILATSTWLFLGFEQAIGFELYRLHQQLCSLVPKRTSRDYALFSDAIDPVAELRLGNSGLSMLSCGDLTAFLNRLSSRMAEARQRQKEQLTMTLVSSSRPYKYLDSYAEMDSDLFCGRANNVSELIGSIIGNEAVVLFGNSGVGKTSLLEAGIAPKCHAQGLAFVKMRVIPDPLQAVCSALNLPVPASAPSGRWLSILLAEMRRRRRPAVVVAFDQFEEFFSELSTAVQSDFWDDLALARVDKSAQFHFVFSIRQEALYLIKNAFPALPKPYALTYSLERMNRTQQKEVVETPAKLVGRPWDSEIVDRILDDISTYPAETAQLSLLLTTLWENRSAESDMKNYLRLGGVAGILRDYLWKAVDSMERRDDVRTVLKAFVSPEKRKSQISIEDLEAEIRRSKPDESRHDISLICDQLIDLRLLRRVPTGRNVMFELSHDLLADAIAETIGKEELENKYIKRMIRAAIQDFQATKILPGNQEFERLAGYGFRIALLHEDYTFLALCAANLGRDPQGWLAESLRQGGNVKDFFSLCIESGSLRSLHEVLHQISTDELGAWMDELIAIGQLNYPSVRRHFRDMIQSCSSEQLPGELTSLVHEQSDGVVVPSGLFVFGIAGAGELCVPEVKVWTDEFSIDRFPVTNLEYRQFVSATGHPAPRHWEGNVIPSGQEYVPVTYVSWFDAAKYTLWKGKRLPTEAEWERAAYWNEANSRKQLYPWGNSFDKLRANYFETNIGMPSPIGQFSPAGDSPYGVSDMAGNVYEWVLDDAVEPFQGFADTKNPINLLGKGQQFKMARGGSYGGPAEQLQCGYRQYARAATTRDAYVGFRCVSSPLTNHKEYMVSFLKLQQGYGL